MLSNILKPAQQIVGQVRRKINIHPTPYCAFSNGKHVRAFLLIFVLWAWMFIIIIFSLGTTILQITINLARAYFAAAACHCGIAICLQGNVSEQLLVPRRIISQKYLLYSPQQRTERIKQSRSDSYRENQLDVLSPEVLDTNFFCGVEPF